MGDVSRELGHLTKLAKAYDTHARNARMVMRESRMQGQLACPVWRGLGRNGSQQWEDRAPLPPYVTWLTTNEPHVFLYLYSLLDHFTRKIVAWFVRDAFTSDHWQALWDQALINEGLLDQPRAQWPASLSDRGAQMRSHSTRQYFAKLGVRQLISRPRTPNDNPRIEAHFGTVKTHPSYPGSFADHAVADAYFTDFYDWYNHIHLLTTMDLLTPDQVHTGQTTTLLNARAAQSTLAQQTRRAACRAPFTLEDLTAQPLPDVSSCPVYSWAGPSAIPQNTRQLLRN